MPSSPVVLAVIIGAHGVTGEVRLKLFTESPDRLMAHKRFNQGALVLTSLRTGSNGPIARFDGVSDRTAAELLRGTELSVARAALPPLNEGEYYHIDLIGLPCISTLGEPLGRCVAVDNFGAGDVLEIERPFVGGKAGKRFMVPMTSQAVPEWKGGQIIVDAGFVT